MSSLLCSLFWAVFCLNLPPGLPSCSCLFFSWLQNLLFCFVFLSWFHSPEGSGHHLHFAGFGFDLNQWQVFAGLVSGPSCPRMHSPDWSSSGGRNSQSELGTSPGQSLCVLSAKREHLTFSPGIGELWWSKMHQTIGVSGHVTETSRCDGGLFYTWPQVP